MIHHSNLDVPLVAIICRSIILIKNHFPDSQNIFKLNFSRLSKFGSKETRLKTLSFHVFHSPDEHLSWDCY